MQAGLPIPLERGQIIDHRVVGALQAECVSGIADMFLTDVKYIGVDDKVPQASANVVGQFTDEVLELATVDALAAVELVKCECET